MPSPVPLDQPIQMLPLFRERVWGREDLRPYFLESPRKHRIGEVWFTFEENRTATGQILHELLSASPEILGTAADPEHPGICPLLVKLLFTTERLSVQVHPEDDYAREHHGSLGKTEAWYVMDAQPPAEVAVGFQEPLTPERLRETAVSGEIEGLLDWRKVAAGDLIFTPAGTVHAIGAGLTICEIQENSDITYRLYDYGRGRELHLEHGMHVSRLGRHEHKAERLVLDEGREELLACSYFRVENLRLTHSLVVEGRLPHYLLMICVKGEGTIAGENFRAGQCWLVPARSATFVVAGTGSEWLLTYTADRPADGLRMDLTARG
jgi:mannose-6-phosphate isomerase